MKILIIYDSVFGNTEQIAQAAGAALGLQAGVEVVRVSDVKPEQLTGLNLLIVGSPTRGFRPTPATSQFLAKLPANSLKGVKVAAFDTRVQVSDIGSSIGRFFVKAGGYAAKPIADRLKKCGGNLVMPPEGFFVNGEKGPLKDGELARAGVWAKQILEGEKVV
jgi:flavodoxin